MAGGTRGGSDECLSEALDRCIARMRRGGTVHRCLKAHPELASALEPLLKVAESVNASRVVLPAPPCGLEVGRERLLAAAESLRAESLRTGSSEGDGVADALDEAISAERRRAALEVAPATAEGDGHEFAPWIERLVELSREIEDSVIRPPSPPTQLARGRDRLMAIAAEQRLQLDVQAGLAGALDAAIALREGGLEAAAAVDAALDVAASTAPSTGDGAASASRWQTDAQARSDLADLVALAEQTRGAVVPPPNLDTVLERGRKDLLARAAQRRAARQSPTWKERLAALMGSTPRRSVYRTAAVTIATVLLLFASGRVVAPAAAASLPGDSLYSLKLLGERVQLALAFDPVQRQRLEASQASRRGNEILALLDKQRAAEIERWLVLLWSFEDQTGDDGVPQGVLNVYTVDDEGAETIWSLDWDEATVFELRGLFEHPSEVPPGSRLLVRLAVEPEKTPLALVVRLLTPGEEEPEATEAPAATATETAWPEDTEVPEDTATPTEESPTPEPTTTAEPSAEPFASDTPDQVLTGKPERDRLRGVVESMPSAGRWIVRAEGIGRGSEIRGRPIDVDVSRLSSGTTDLVRVGDWVQVTGRFVDELQTAFIVASVDRHVPGQSGPGPEKCSVNHVIGYVAGYVPVSALTLTDGSQYDLTELGQVAPSGLQVGSRVGVEYRDCGDGKRVATAIDLLEGPAETTLRGTVDAAAPGRFDVVLRGGSRYAVIYDAETTLIGAGAVEDGQTVQVKGWLDDKDILHATEIRVKESAPDAGSTGEAALPTATVQAPSPTPGSGGDGGAGIPTAEAIEPLPVAPSVP